MNQPLSILHIEDSRYDSELVKHMLEADGLECEITRIETRPELIDALKKTPYDLILSDCTLPQFSGLQALELSHALKPTIPFIFVSGTIGEEIAIQSLRDGATDYVLKNRIARLVPAVRRALQEADERSMRRAMEGRLHQARRLEVIGTLAGGLVHDFNNLLQIIKTNVSLLPLEADHPDKVVKISETLHKITDRGSNLLKELLVFARKTEARLTSVDISRQISDIAEILETALLSDVKLILQPGENLPPIFADPIQLDRIITNLVINARDAMPGGGTITISAEVVEFDPAPPHSWQLDNVPYICLKIVDTGVGMEEADKLRAFDPFFTTKELGQGTGLGLSVVFGLMQIHNGFIDLQSKLGEGTAISLFFPLPHQSVIAPEKIKKIPPFQLLGGSKSGRPNRL